MKTYSARTRWDTGYVIYKDDIGLPSDEVVDALNKLTHLRTQADMLGPVCEALAQCTEDMIDRRIPVRKYTKVLTAARAVLGEVRDGD